MELTLRQYYIGKALQGYLSNELLIRLTKKNSELQGHSWDKEVALNVVETVDSLMQTLEEKDGVPEQEIFQNYDRIPIGYFAERLRRLSSKSMATRFMNACAYFDINTIGELVKFKSTQFMRGRNIGRTMIESIGCALQEYGIENW